MILLVLIALAARLDASPTDDARPATSDGVAEAIRYANVLTGDDLDDLTASDRIDDARDDDDDDDCDDDDCGDDDCNDDDCDDDECRDDNRNADGRDTDGRDADGRDDDGDDRLKFALAGDEDDESDRSASFEDVSSDLAEAAMAGHLAGELAMQDAGAADSSAAAGEDVSFAATSAGAAQTYESWMRHQRPSPWGRLDLGVAWRRRWSEPLIGMSRRYDEVLLVATWRR